MKQLFLITLTCLFFTMLSCSSDETEPVDEALDYVPLTEGSWYEYTLDSTIYRDFDNSVATREYYLRVEIGDSFMHDGQEVTRILRYVKPRNITNANYLLQSVWFASVVNNRLETTEENLDFIKFLFPPFTGTTWNGNERIEGEGADDPTHSTVYFEGWEYEIIFSNQPYSLETLNFDRVAQVNQSDEVGGPGAIRHLVSDEWYARGVGLIKKRMEMVVENCGEPGCSDKTKPVLEREDLRKGYILDLELIDYQIQ